MADICPTCNLELEYVGKSKEKRFIKEVDHINDEVTKMEYYNIDVKLWECPNKCGVSHSEEEV